MKLYLKIKGNMNRILDFSEIDELFLKYKKAIVLPNNEEFINTQISLIVEALWLNIKSQCSSIEIEEYPDVMVEKTIYCIKEFAKKDETNGFSAYAFVSIKRHLASCARNASFDDRTGGMHASDNRRKILNKLNRLYRSFVSLRKSQETDIVIQDKFIKYAMDCLGVEKAIVVDFLSPKESMSMDVATNDDVFDITDFFGGSNFYSSENDLLNAESVNSVLKKIESEWQSLKQGSKPLMSELLTLTVLLAIERGFIKFGAQDSLLEVLKKYRFICEGMISVQNLPTQQEIGNKYGLTKSAVSVKVSRFFEKIKKS